MPDFELSRPATLAEAAVACSATEPARAAARRRHRPAAQPAPRPRTPAAAGRPGRGAGVRRRSSPAPAALATRRRRHAGAARARDERIAQRATARWPKRRAPVAGPGHRSAATLGGNLCLDTRCVFYNQSEWWRAANDYCLKRGGDVCHVAPQGKRCHAAFSGDLAPALLALGAEVELLSSRGARAASPLAELLSRRRRGPPDARRATKCWSRVHRAGAGARAASAAIARRACAARWTFRWPASRCALCVRDGAIAGELRVALTGTNSQPLLLDGTDALLGKPVDDAAARSRSASWCRSRSARCARR